jgi:hypothetical protein
MRRLIWVFVAIACLCVTAAGQTTTSSKRRVVKTGPPNGLFSPAIVTGDLSGAGGY